MNITIDMAQLMVAAGGMLTLFGGAFAWLFRTVSGWRRDIEAKLTICEAHHKVSNHRKMSQAGVIRFLIDAWRAADPDNVMVRHAEAMLNEMDRQTREMSERLGLAASHEIEGD